MAKDTGPRSQRSVHREYVIRHLYMFPFALQQFGVDHSPCKLGQLGLCQLSLIDPPRTCIYVTLEERAYWRARGERIV